jgi:hypothetical protein
MRKSLSLAGFLLVGFATVMPSEVSAQAQDPRIGLRAGVHDAGEAAWNLNLLVNIPRPAAFIDPANIGNLAFANSDLAFQGNLVFVGNFHGFNIYDVSDPANPTLRTSVVCPGGQGDLSVQGNLLFMSVEETRGRIDCGAQGAGGQVNPERFRGVRIFDISNLDAPVQVAAVQTCRGSHTHSLMDYPGDTENLYVLVSGSAGVRSGDELAGCSGQSPDENPDATSLFRIEVIQVPLAAPQNARVIAQPRVFTDAASGRVDGLWPGGVHGEGTQRTSATNHCHDITAYPAIGLAAGACSGNGILLDIRNPNNLIRVDEVIDTNFAYWHSATFNNDGTTVIFTDEWGGGTSPRCRDTDPAEWGANAFFRVENGKMTFAGYYKLPVPQTAQENCVAHNGSLIPVPGRDIKVQAWYQGGLSIFDFTDPANAYEIAYFDRGPLSETQLQVGGFWSTYWYNGYIYGSEIARGLDVFRLAPSEHLTQNEIDAANLIRWNTFNPQNQPRVEWPAHPAVARAYADQLVRSGAADAAQRTQLFEILAQYEAGGAQRAAALPMLTEAANQVRQVGESARGVDADRSRALSQVLLTLARGEEVTPESN